MVSFIDSHKETYGVEPICRCLPIAPATFYEKKARQRDLTRLPERKQRDLRLQEKILKIWNENLQVNGVRKVWHRLTRESASVSMRTDLVLDALEQALHARRDRDVLVHHSDRGVQYLSIRYTERPAEAGVHPSFGTAGDLRYSPKLGPPDMLRPTAPDLSFEQGEIQQCLVNDTILLSRPRWPVRPSKASKA
jgi:hypothetical protein